jgi:ribose transport system substrate-binding protein
MSRGSKTVVALFMALLAAGALAACGSDKSTSSTTSAGADAAAATTAATSAADGKAAAAQAIAPYIGKPGKFPVVEALSKSPKGAKIAYMDCGTPVCALFWTLLEPAGKTMGVQISRVKTGSSAATVDSAFSSVVAQKPDAVIVTAIDISLWQNHLKELQAAKIPVVTTGVTGVKEKGVDAPQAAESASSLEGKLLADYVAAEMKGKKIALYKVPELPFTAIVASAFTDELKKVCPDCSARSVDVSVTTIGNTAPAKIVSDLQAHPDTETAVFAIDEAQTGLPAALKTAGINIETIGNSPGPTNLQYIRDGQETAALGVDLPVLIWTTLDIAARKIGGQGLKGDEAEGISPVQFLRKQDIVFDPSKGWTGYPDFGKRFATLWAAGA